MGAVYSRVTEVSFCAMPLDDHEATSWTITVAWRGPGDLYAVADRCGQNLSRSGKWHFESRPSSRTDRFKRDHRFSFDDACRLAEMHAPKVVCNGLTAPQVPVFRQAIDDGHERHEALAIARGEPAPTGASA